MAKAENTIESLLKLVSSGKATASDKIQLAELLNNSAKEEAVIELQGKIAKVKAYITELGLTVEQVINGIKAPAQCIFKWTKADGTVHSRFEGEKGKLPAWTTELKNTVSKEEAKKFALTEKGKSFIETVYG